MGDAMTIAILAIALWYAWRYSRTEIDPDWAMFNLAAFTGAWYGRDFLDCKTPLIHLWYWAIAKVVGADIRRVRFAHHVLVSLPGVIIGGWSGLAFVALVNTGWLLGFHGNVGQPAAGLILLSLWVSQPWLSVALIILAVAFEPKLILAAALLSLPLQRMPWAFGLAASTGVGVLILRWLRPQWWKWIWEANVTIGGRMARMRRDLWKQGIDLTYTAGRGMMILFPWAVIAVLEKPDWRYWIAPAGYLLTIAVGIVVRDNHYLILAPWLALAMPVWACAALVAADLASGFGYLGDIWGRYYQGLRGVNIDAQKIGEWLRDQPGRVWVNGLHSGVYIHARKPPIGGFAEQIEIRENASERREVWRAAFKADPPEWVVVGYMPGWSFSGKGYSKVLSTGFSEIYRRQQ